MRSILTAAVVAIFCTAAFSQDMPPPRMVDRDYRSEYRKALREAEKQEREAEKTPGDVIQLPKEETVPTDVVTLFEMRAQDELTWHLDQITPGKTRERLAAAWKYPVVIEGYDTGVDEDHPAMQYGKLPSIDYTGEGIDDRNNHGTHTLGTIVGQDHGILWPCVGPGKLEWRAISVLNGNGFGNFNWYATAHGDRYDTDYKKGGYRVTVNSLGANVDELLNYVEFELKKGWERHGVMHVAAAGNSNSSVDYPGSSPYTLAVGAVDRNLVRAYFSCFGPELTAAMPGVDIYAPIKDGKYGRFKGTSMAAPMLAAWVAAAYGIHGEKVAAPEDLTRYAEKCARDLGEAGRDDYYGYGMAMLNQILAIDPDSPGEEPDEPDEPAPEAEYELSVVVKDQVMLWKPAGNREWQVLTIPHQVVRAKVKAASFADALEKATSTTEKYYTNRGIIGVRDADEALKWTGIFLGIVFGQQDADGSITTATASLNGNEWTRTDYSRGAAMYQGTTPELVERD
jgi:hypothetical protein